MLGVRCPRPLIPSVQRRSLKLFGARREAVVAEAGSSLPQVKAKVEMKGLMALIQQHTPPPARRAAASPHPKNEVSRRPRLSTIVAARDRIQELHKRLNPAIIKLLALPVVEGGGGAERQGRRGGREGVAIAGIVVDGAPSGFATVGVNFTFHELLLGGTASHTLPGLLKGCAEQNALGCLAAGGMHRYEEVSEVYLVAVRKRVWDPQGGLSSVLPCPACWSALCAIHSQRLEATGGGKGLTVHVSTGANQPDTIPAHLEGTLYSAQTLLQPGLLPRLVLHTFP